MLHFDQVPSIGPDAGIGCAQPEVWTPEAVFPVVERNTLRWRHPAVETESTVHQVELFGIG